MYIKIRWRYTEAKEKSGENKLTKKEKKTTSTSTSSNYRSDHEDKISANRQLLLFLRLLLLLDS